jgi:kynurenine formamidase
VPLYFSAHGGKSTPPAPRVVGDSIFGLETKGAVMATKRFIDLSIGIEPGLPSDPPMMIPKIDYIDHTMGGEQMKEFYPGLNKEQLPGGLGWAVEFITLTTHSGTHLDAPYHYHPTMDGGERALTIDEIPLEWCFADYC